MGSNLSAAVLVDVQEDFSVRQLTQTPQFRVGEAHDDRKDGESNASQESIVNAQQQD